MKDQMIEPSKSKARIHLSDTDLPEIKGFNVGDMVTIIIKGKVTSVSMNQYSPKDKKTYSSSIELKSAKLNESKDIGEILNDNWDDSEEEDEDDDK